MDNFTSVSKLTYVTLQWLYYRKRDDELLRVKSPTDIKKLIMKYVYTTSQEDKDRFIKGARLIDTEALFVWVCEKINYEVSVRDMTISLLDSIRDRAPENKPEPMARTVLQG